MNMDFGKLASDLVGNLAKDLDLGDLGPVLGELLGGKDGKIDLNDIVGKMENSGLGDIVGSWLGDGSNRNIATDQLKDIFRDRDLGAIARKVDRDEDDLLAQLGKALPDLIDKSSRGGKVVVEPDTLGDLLGKLFK